VGAITLEEGINEYVYYLCKQGAFPSTFQGDSIVWKESVMHSYGGIFHFHEFLYRTHFTLHINHKLLEWLAIMPNAYGKHEM